MELFEESVVLKLYNDVRECIADAEYAFHLSSVYPCEFTKNT